MWCEGLADAQMSGMTIAVPVPQLTQECHLIYKFIAFSNVNASRLTHWSFSTSRCYWAESLMVRSLCRSAPQASCFLSSRTWLLRCFTAGEGWENPSDVLFFTLDMHLLLGLVRYVLCGALKCSFLLLGHQSGMLCSARSNEPYPAWLPGGGFSDWWIILCIAAWEAVPGDAAAILPSYRTLSLVAQIQTIEFSNLDLFSTYRSMISSHDATA